MQRLHSADLVNVIWRGTYGAVRVDRGVTDCAARVADAVAADTAFLVGVEGAAPSWVTSTVTNRASSQSAHFVAFFIKSAR